MCEGCLVPQIKCAGSGPAKDEQVVAKACPGVTRVFAASPTRTGYGPLDWGHGMGDYTTAIWVTIGLTVALTVPVVWQFLQPNDDEFGDLTRRK